MSKLPGKIVPASLDTRGILFVGISLVLAGAGLLLALFIDDQNIRVFGLSLGIALIVAVSGFIIGLHFVDRKTAEFLETLDIPTLEELERTVDDDLKRQGK